MDITELLSPRQAEVLLLIRDGLTNAQIAERLGLSEGTIKTHASASFLRLGAHSRIEAAAMLDRKDGDLSSSIWTDVTHLTRRQAQILNLVAEGFTNRQIARHLHFGEKTVKSHLSIIYQRLGAQNRAHAAAILRRNESLPIRRQIAENRTPSVSRPE